MRRRDCLLYAISAAAAGALAEESKLRSEDQAPPQFWSALIAAITEVTTNAPIPKITVAAGSPLPLASRFIFTNELEFQPGGKLVLTGDLGPLGEKIIVAKKLIISSGAAADLRPQISWSNAATEMRSPAPAGKAPSGSVGRFPGEKGQAGPVGIQGNTGFPGRDAPNLFLVVKEIVVNGPLLISLPGQDGGTGGEGQIGGDGGLGRPGSPGISVLFNCKRSGDRGSDGGNAGNGGLGGSGGRGGNGGSVVAFGPVSVFKALELALVFDTSAGKGGKGGKGGAPGSPGSPGPGGRPVGNCLNPSDAGQPGAPGLEGGIGHDGPDGVPGDIRSGLLTPESIRTLKL